MSRRNRRPEGNARREKIRELLQLADISSIDDIQSLFRETAADFMSNGLEEETEDEPDYSKYDHKRYRSTHTGYLRHFSLRQHSNPNNRYSCRS